MTVTTQLDQLCINTLRTLSIDAVQQAQSGHPGTPMDAAPTAYCLWQRFLRYDPEDPNWPNRDRFVLSSGHASMLLYSLLHLCGVKAMSQSYEKVGGLAVTLDDIKRFRQAGSRCTGHPEYGWTSGVETTTGPLGQGVATSVGMAIAEKMPWLLGGAADLAPSTKTHLNFEFAGDFQAPDEAGDYRGRNFHYGVREHAMCAISNGLSLSNLRPYAASFLVFTDYCRGALRLAAMMEIPVITIWTHDSISMGEDGPTHQPVEQLASLHAMPGMMVLRPADANEVVEAWRVIMQLKDRPVCLVLTRQALATLDRTRYAPARGVARGAYVLADAPDHKPDVLLLATGSEVALCIAAYEQLKLEGINARVVSMPSWELFESQDQAYRDSVLPPQISARVAVEAASSFGWERYTGFGGSILGVDTFGLSAPMKVVAQHFGFESAHVVAAARDQVLRHALKR